MSRGPSEEEVQFATRLLIVVAVILGASLLGWMAGSGLWIW